MGYCIPDPPFDQVKPSSPYPPLPTPATFPLPDDTQEKEAGVRIGGETGENCPPPRPLLEPELGIACAEAE